MSSTKYYKMTEKEIDAKGFWDFHRNVIDHLRALNKRLEIVEAENYALKSDLAALRRKVK